jgi:hypothetical protein
MNRKLMKNRLMKNRLLKKLKINNQVKKKYLQ